MMSNYTPGPWGYRSQYNEFSNEYDFVVFGPEKEFICTIPDRGVKRHKADVNLIAAAPEMVDLLDDVLLELGIVSSSLPSNCRGHVDELRDRIDALLLRIEGTE